MRGGPNLSLWLSVCSHFLANRASGLKGGGKRGLQVQQKSLGTNCWFGHILRTPKLCSQLPTRKIKLRTFEKLQSSTSALRILRKSGRCWTMMFPPFSVYIGKMPKKKQKKIHQTGLWCFCFLPFNQKGRQKWAIFSCLHVCQVTAATVFTLSKGLEPNRSFRREKKTTSKRSVKNYGFFRCWKKNHWPDIILRLSICRACKGWHGMTWVTHGMLQSNRPVKSLSHH